MSRPVSTVLIAGAGCGPGPDLVQHWLARGATVLCTCRAPQRAAPLQRLVPGSGRRLHLLQLDVASDASLLALSQALLSATHRERPIDLLINLASMRQIVGLDRLDLREAELPFSFALLPTLRVVYAVLSALSPGALLACIAGTPTSASEFGSLRRPPRVSPAGLQAALRGLAADLQARQSSFAVLYPGRQRGAAAEKAAWIAATLDQVLAGAPDERPRPRPRDGLPLIFSWKRA